jgi:hypothetical protein
MTSNALGAAFLILAGYAGCNEGNAGPKSTLRAIYSEYHEGAINECQLDGKLVYTAQLNAYDAGAIIIDRSGKKIGTCNYGWGPVDSVCKLLQSCETVYRCKGHISGEPAVDKYGLGK